MTVLAESVGLVYFAAGLISLVFSYIGIRRRDRPGSRGFVIFTAGITLWCLGLSVPKYFGGVPYSPGFFYVVMLAAQLSTVGWLLLIFEFTGRWPLSRAGNVAIGVFVLFGQLAVWSNPRHELLLGPGTEVTGAILLPDLGPVFWMLTSVEYLIIGGSTVIIWGEVRRSSRSRRTQSLVIFLSTFPPVVASLVAITEFGATSHDVTPFGFLISEGLFAWGLYRAQFLEIVPIARTVVIEEMRDAAITVDGEDYLVDYNRAAAELFALDETAIGRPISTAITHDGLLELIRSESGAGRELTIEHGDEIVQVHVSVSSLDVPGARGSRVCVLRDITPLKEREQELRQREAELEQHNDQLDRFAGIVSHDLRNPLQVAEGRLELAREDIESDHLDAIAENHERMERMIDNLLTLARAGTGIDERDSVALKSAIEDAWSNVQTEPATLQIDIQENRTVQADREPLLHVFENLFRNAVDHNVQPVTVTVGAFDGNETADDRRTGFYVEDDGDGVSESNCEDIFDHGHTTSQSGTGFGLSIVRDIVDAHGWNVHISEGTEGGARFEITGVETE